MENKKKVKPMKIVFCHGELGGVGKSMACMAILEHILAEGIDPYLIEGDTICPSTAKRYQGVIEGAQFPLGQSDRVEDVLIGFLGHLEEYQETLANRIVVVNLPPRAAPTVDCHAALIHEICEKLGYSIATLYLIGNRLESVRTAVESFAEGLVSVSDQKIALRNLSYGDPDGWQWSLNGYQDLWEKKGGKVLDFHKLSNYLVERIDNIGPLGPLINGEKPGLTSLERVLIKKWLRLFGPVLDVIDIDKYKPVNWLRSGAKLTR